MDLSSIKTATSGSAIVAGTRWTIEVRIFLALFQIPGEFSQPLPQESIQQMPLLCAKADPAPRPVNTFKCLRCFHDWIEVIRLLFSTDRSLKVPLH